MATASERTIVRIYGVDIDRLSMRQAVDRLRAWLDGDSMDCHIVVTPNLDHIVRLQRDSAMRFAYRSASMVVADGWPVVVSSRWLGRSLPERVAGSDLVPGLFATARPDRPLRVFLLGAMPGIADRAAERIAKRWPDVQVVGTCSPVIGFDRDPIECKAIVHRIATVEPDLLVVGLGAPKQEIWLDRHRELLRCKVAIAAGATIDFLAGAQQRAPRWLQSVHLEWLYRLCREPKRLARRYLHDALMFPAIFWNEWKSARGSAR